MSTVPDTITAELQARVWAAATGKAIIRYADTATVVNEDGYYHPDLLTWDGCGQLIEAMRAKGWWWEIHWDQEGAGRPDGPAIAFVRNDETATQYSATANLPPEAAVLAAAKALGVSDAIVENPA